MLVNRECNEMKKVVSTDGQRPNHNVSIIEPQNDEKNLVNNKLF